MMTVQYENTAPRIQRLAERFREKSRFLLLTHVNPDGDALGSLIGMGLGLRSLGKQVVMCCESGVPYLYDFLPGVEHVVAEVGDPRDYDAVVLLDCHALKRAGKQASAMTPLPWLAVVDHHIVEDELPEDALVDTTASAAGELVYHLLVAMGAAVTDEIAANLFVAVSTDTGSFSYENTSPGALAVGAELVRCGARPWDVFQAVNLNKRPERLRLLGMALQNMEFFHGGNMGALTVTTDMLASAGATAVDVDGFVEYPRSVQGVELAALFRETGNGACKVSLRSRGGFDTADLARSFGGGGHRNAAGFSLPGALEDVKKQVVEAAGRRFPAADRRSAP